MGLTQTFGSTRNDIAGLSGRNTSKCSVLGVNHQRRQASAWARLSSFSSILSPVSIARRTLLIYEVMLGVEPQSNAMIWPNRRACTTGLPVS